MISQILTGINSMLATVAVNFTELPKQIDPNTYKSTFVEDFNTLDATPTGPSRWTTHTWWNGDFGDASFTDPGPYSPFSVANGVLTITASHGHDGWKSGLLSTIDPSGRGFAQKYGYFEMRAKMPLGAGVWPGFWLVSTGSRHNLVELDVVEYYGVSPDRFYSTVHVWNDDNGNQKVNNPYTTTGQAGEFADGFHTYGVLVTPKTLGFYYDRQLKVVAPTPEDHNRPLGVLVDLALGGGWPIDKTPNPSRMLVDYIKVWSLPPTLGGQ
jgi:beta-glucanase (GH16 family)